MPPIRGSSCVSEVEFDGQPQSTPDEVALAEQVLAAVHRGEDPDLSPLRVLGAALGTAEDTAWLLRTAGVPVRDARGSVQEYSKRSAFSICETLLEAQCTF